MCEITGLYKCWDKNSSKYRSTTSIEVLRIKIDGKEVKIIQNIYRNYKGQISVHTFAESDMFYAHLHPGKIFICGNC
jgi:uncharacterized protein (DUF2461 family)